MGYLNPCFKCLSELVTLQQGSATKTLGTQSVRALSVETVINRLVFVDDMAGTRVHSAKDRFSPAMHIAVCCEPTRTGFNPLNFNNSF